MGAQSVPSTAFPDPVSGIRPTNPHFSADVGSTTSGDALGAHDRCSITVASVAYTRISGVERAMVGDGGRERAHCSIDRSDLEYSAK